MQKIFFNHYLSASLDASVASHESIDFIAGTFLPYYKGITIRLRNFISSPKNFLFLKDLCDYCSFLQSENREILLDFDVDCDNLTPEIAELVDKSNVSWWTCRNLNSGLPSDLYFDLKSGAKWKYKGNVTSFSIQEFSYKEAFLKSYDFAYGFPITVETKTNDLNQKTTEKITNSYKEFSEFLIEQTKNIKTGTLKSFFSGNGFFRNLIKTISQNDGRVFRRYKNNPSPYLNKNGELKAFSGETAPEIQIGNIKNSFVDLEKFFNVESEFKNNEKRCPDCECKKICPLLKNESQKCELVKKTVPIAKNLVFALKKTDERIFNLVNQKEAI